MTVVSSAASQAGLPSGGSSRSLLTPLLTFEPPLGSVRGTSAATGSGSSLVEVSGSALVSG